MFMTLGLENLFAFGKCFRFSLHNTRDITRGVRGHNSPGAESLWEAKKFQQCHEHFFSKQYICFRKTSRSNMGRQTCFLLQALSNLDMHLHNAHHDCLAKMAKFVYKNTRQSVANYQSQKFKTKCCWLLRAFDHRKYLEGRKRGILFQKQAQLFLPSKKCLGYAKRYQKTRRQ